MNARGRRGGKDGAREGDRQPSAASASLGHFVHLWTPLPNLQPLFAALLRPPFGPPAALSSSSFFPPVSPRNEKERHGYFNENPARLCRHLVSSPPPPPPPPRSRATTAVARLMNALCKYYFCLCTRQLSATLVLINNAKQSAGATGSWRRSLPA